MSENCPDHGDDEKPWMCTCTEKKLENLERENAELRKQVDTVTKNAVDLLCRCDKHPDCTIQDIQETRCPLCVKEDNAKLQKHLMAALDFIKNWRQACVVGDVYGPTTEDMDSMIAKLEVKK